MSTFMLRALHRPMVMLRTAEPGSGTHLRPQAPPHVPHGVRHGGSDHILLQNGGLGGGC